MPAPAQRLRPEVATPAAAVHAVLDALDAASVPVYVAGAWGIDALLGRETRSHDNLDVAVPFELGPQALDVLARVGYTVDVDWRPVPTGVYAQ